MNRDISTFIDPVIQDFIYQNGLYLRDTQDKPLLNARDLSFQWVERPDPLLVADVTAGHRERESLRTAILRDGDQLLVLRHRREGGGAHAGLAQLPLSVYSRPLLRVSKRRSGGPGAPAGGR